LLKKLATPPELPGTAEATCTDERGPEAGLDSAEARLSVLALIVSAGGSNPGGLTWGGIVPAAVRMAAPGPPWVFSAVRNAAFLAPSPPILTGAGAVPGLIRSAGWVLSRGCLSLTASAMSSGIL